MMWKTLSLILCLILMSGCSHCSRTITDFDGKTHGLNPYGTGKAKVTREAYWGNLQCILKLIGQKEKNVSKSIYKKK